MDRQPGSDRTEMPPVESSFQLPVHGFVPAAGEGRRLRPYSLEIPKPLMPLLGIPLLEVVLDRMGGLSPRSVVVNACHLADRIEEHVRYSPAARKCSSVVISRESRLLDTGGGIRRGLEVAGIGEATVVVHNADVYTNFPLATLVSRHRESRSLATLLLKPGEGPLTVDAGRDWVIRALREPRGRGRFTFTGVYVLDTRLLTYLPARNVCSIVEALEAAIGAGERILGVSAGDRYWSDLGTPAELLRAHEKLLRVPAALPAILRSGARRGEERRCRLRNAGCSVSATQYVGPGALQPPGSVVPDGGV